MNKFRTISIPELKKTPNKKYFSSTRKDSSRQYASDINLPMLTKVNVDPRSKKHFS